MTERLTKPQLAAWRELKIEEQGGVCTLCGLPFTERNPGVGDHDHTTGQLRDVLHRGCNAMLGVIENGRARYLLKEAGTLSKFLGNLTSYIHKRRPDAPYYPTHRTADQKRELANKRRRASRARRAA